MVEMSRFHVGLISIPYAFWLISDAYHVILEKRLHKIQSLPCDKSCSRERKSSGEFLNLALCFRLVRGHFIGRNNHPISIILKHLFSEMVMSSTQRFKKPNVKLKG